MKKICIITVPLDRKGGVSNYVKLFIDNLDKKKYDLSYFEIGNRKTKLWSAESGLDIIENLFAPFIFIYQFFGLIRHLSHYNPDIVHLNPSLRTYRIIKEILLLKYIANCQIITTVLFHGWENKMEKALDNNNFFRNLFINSLNNSKRIYVLASSFCNTLEKWGVSKERIRITTTMFDSRAIFPIKYEEKKDIVLFCGILKKTKGAHHLLRAIPNVVKYFPKIKFVFIGDGAEKKDLVNRVKKLKISDNVIFTGFIDNDKKYKIISQAKLFVTPSEHGEGLPTVVVESLAHGLYILSTEVGGLVDILEEGKNGDFIKTYPIDYNEISEKILRIFSNEVTLKAVCQNNALYSSNFSSASIVRKFEKDFNSLIGSK